VTTEPIEIAPGAYHAPGWLPLDRQRFAVEQFRAWAAGPVPIRAAKVRGHEMSVRTVCLGWHWQPYTYTREATDVNGQRVLPMPDWLMSRLAYHGVTKIIPGTAPPGCGLDGGRINITLRVTGLA
jgi:hypothetical protein